MRMDLGRQQIPSFILPSQAPSKTVIMLNVQEIAFLISDPLFAGQGKNAFTIKPSYTYWAPWIGRHSRKGNVVFNTEHRKCSRPLNEDDEEGNQDTHDNSKAVIENAPSEEALIEMMHFAQVFFLS